MDHIFLLYLAIILLSTKFLGMVFQRFHLPQVAGALVAGVLIGPMCLHIVQPTDFLVTLAELGVIILMFLAGMEADIKELKKAGIACFIIATLGAVSYTHLKLRKNLEFTLQWIISETTFEIAKQNTRKLRTIIRKMVLFH